MLNKQYIRKGATIKNLSTGEIEHFMAPSRRGMNRSSSISGAKKASHAVQMKEDGGLGRGCLSVGLRKGGRK